MESDKSSLSGMLPCPEQTQKPESLNSRDSLPLPLLLALPQPVRLACLLLLLVLVVSLTACATTSAPPASMPLNPEPPPSVLPSSPPNYLESAQKTISEWRKRLTELTAKPAN